MRSLAPALAALAVALLLAGCSGKAPAAAPADLGKDTAGDAASTPLAGQASFAAPQWKVGQWWEWQTTHGTQTEEATYCSIVVGVDGASYAVATERTDAAKVEATFGLPLLGPIGRADLAMDGWGDAPWSLLSFPLTDGKTWTATVPNIAWDIVDGPTVDLAMVAHVVQPADAKGTPLVHIQGKVDDKLLVSGVYDPAIGWFRDLAFFDVDPGQEALEIGFHAKSAGVNYTGPYFIHTAAPLLDLYDGAGFTDDPTQGGQPFASPEPQGSFTMKDATRLFGYVFAESVVGAREVALVPPQGEPRHAEAVASDLEGAESGFMVDEPGMAGDWHVATGGAGGYSGAEVRLWELTEGNFQLANAS